MKKSQEEKRTRLRAKAEKVIEEYLEWEAKHPQPDLKQIEEISMRLRKELGGIGPLTAAKLLSEIRNVSEFESA